MSLLFFPHSTPELREFSHACIVGTDFVTLPKKITGGQTMATITLEYDGRNTLIKKAIDLIILAGAKIVPVSKAASTGCKPNAKTLKAMREAEKGEVIHYKDSED